MGIRVITVSRQFGSGGRTIGKKVAEKLGIPYYDKELRTKTGLDREVSEFVLGQPETKRFLERWYALLDEIIPGYIKEGKQYLTIGVGCTGGQHRSVALATVTGQHLSQAGYHVNTTHRDLALAEVN